MWSLVIYDSSSSFTFCHHSVINICFHELNLYSLIHISKIVPYVHWTVHHCNSWRIKDQLDVTCSFISVLMCSTCLFRFVSFLWRCGPMRAMASSCLRFLDHTQRRTTVGRTPLDERSARRRDLYLTIHTHNRQTSMPLGGIRTHDHSKRAAADLRLRPRGHWDRHCIYRVC